MPNFETSIETTLAYDLLKNIQIGEVCPYQVLQEKIGKNPQKEGYGHVMSARKRAERELECVFEAVHNLGITKLKPRGVINKGVKDLKHIRKSVHNGTRRQSTLVPVEAHGELNSEERHRFHVNLSHFGILGAVMKPSVRKKIGDMVEKYNKVLDPKETISLFSSPRIGKKSV